MSTGDYEKGVKRSHDNHECQLVLYGIKERTHIEIYAPSYRKD